MPFVDASFNDLVFSPILPPHSHVILHVRLARNCRIYISKSEGKPSPWRSVPVTAIKSFGEIALARPSTNVCEGTPFSRRVRVIYWMMDSATSPSAPRRMTEWGGYTAKSESSRNRETNHREKLIIPIKKGTGAICMGF